MNATRQPDGTCECFPNYSECPGSDGGLICAEILLDNDNCGGCGLVCPTGESCLGGACTCHLTTCSNGDGGTFCTDPESDPLNCNRCGNPCPFLGMSCVLGECNCGQDLLTTAICPLDGGYVCADTTTDDNNCGGCGIVCAADQHCAAPGGAGGVCVCDLDAGRGEPLLTLENCDGVCVDIDTDYDHCGGCTACSAPATQCVHGNCE
jgi:hypothetical protein